MSVAGPPPGYRQSAIGGTLLVAREDQFEVIRAALGTGTLHGWAATQPAARAMQGRGVAWTARIADGPDVVVRHSRHGGMLANLTGDLFLAPTRAPRELDNALRLAAAGVPTPAVIAYAVYGAFGPLCRADVATALVDGADLPAAFATYRGRDERRAISAAVARLIDSMWKAGARHHDLNAKNVLVSTDGGGFRATVIDVDRVTFHPPRNDAAAMRNVERLIRSLRKSEAALGLDIAAYDWTRMSGFGTGSTPITPP